MTTLQVFAFNEPLDIRHTHLTRAKGAAEAEAAPLPPLAAWLGVETINEGEIEVFPVADLDGMTLSDYVGMAFAPESLPSDARARMDAVQGTVLLVPSDAMVGTPAPGAEVTQVATLELARPDHSAQLPKVDVRPLPNEGRPGAAPKKRGSGSVVKLLIGFAILIALYLIVER